jgi:hypothetical protein
VEVISAPPRDVRRDHIEKPDEYAAFGVPFYWLIDPVARTLETFELGADGRYVRALAGRGRSMAQAAPSCCSTSTRFGPRSIAWDPRKRQITDSRKIRTGVAT